MCHCGVIIIIDVKTFFKRFFVILVTFSTFLNVFFYFPNVFIFKKRWQSSERQAD